MTSKARIAAISLVLASAPAANPQSLQFDTSPSSLRMAAGGFQMSVVGRGGSGPLVVQSSSNLIDWLSITTNPPSMAAFDYTDPSATNLQSQFYRALESGPSQSNIYSLNDVGFATVIFPPGNSLHVNPFTSGSSNGANEVFSSLPDATIIFLWTGRAYDAYAYDTSIGLSSNNWYYGDESTPRGPPALPPGLGFFIDAGNAFTNTFVGSVFPGPGQTNTIALPLGFSLVGSTLPVSGPVSRYTRLDPPSNPLWQFPRVDCTFVYKWLGSRYDAFYYCGGCDIGGSYEWWLADGSTPRSAPKFDIGEGFFFFTTTYSGPAIWRQGLPAF